MCMGMDPMSYASSSSYLFIVLNIRMINCRYLIVDINRCLFRCAFFASWLCSTLFAALCIVIWMGHVHWVVHGVCCLPVCVIFAVFSTQITKKKKQNTKNLIFFIIVRKKIEILCGVRCRIHIRLSIHHAGV